MTLLTYGIVLILLSILAVPSLLLSKKPDAKELFDKIAPFQGYIGIVFCLIGVWGLIDALRAMSLMMSFFPVLWLTWLACALSLIILGFLLGYSLIVKYALSKNEAAKQKGEQLMAKLQPLQGTIGIIGICVGVWSIIAYFMYRIG